MQTSFVMFQHWSIDMLSDEIKDLNRWIQHEKDWIKWIEHHLRYGFCVKEFTHDSAFVQAGYSSPEDLFENLFLPVAHEKIRLYETEIQKLRELIFLKEMQEGQE